MHLMRTLIAVSFVLASVAACGTTPQTTADSGSPTDAGATGDAGSLCSFWGDGTNCFKQSISQAAMCLPAISELGVLSADGATCTYASGSVVTFDTPVTFPIDTHVWKFTIKNGATQCLRFDQTDTKTLSFKITDSAGTFNYQINSNLVTATCPNGSAFTNTTVDSLNCPDASVGLTGIPSYAAIGQSGAGADRVTFGLTGTVEGNRLIFACAR